MKYQGDSVIGAVLYLLLLIVTLPFAIVFDVMKRS